MIYIVAHKAFEMPKIVIEGGYTPIFVGGGKEYARSNNSLTDDYKSLPLPAASQSVLKQLNTNCLSFFKSLKSYNKNPSKYNGRPKMPKYLDKENGRFVFALTNQNCKLKDGFLNFPKSFNGFTLP